MAGMRPGDADTPPDGGYGWVIVIGGMVAHIIIGGGYYAGGIFILEFVEYFEQGGIQASWIVALNGLMTLVSGLPAAALVKRFGTRPVLTCGGLLATLGIVCSSFAKSLPMLYVTYGFIAGIGHGFSSVPCLLHLTQYFRKKYAVANGLVFSGYSSGLLTFPLLLRYLIDSYGWRGAMLIIGAVNANLIVCGALMRPLNPRTAGVRTHKSEERRILDRYDEVLGLKDEKTPMLLLRHEIHLSNRKDKQVNGGYSITSENLVNLKNGIDCRSITNGSLANLKNGIECSSITNGSLANLKSGTESRFLTQNCTQIWTWRLRKISTQLRLNLFAENYAFTLLCLAQFLEGVGFSAANTHLFARIVYSGISKTSASVLLTITGGISLAAKLGHGFLVDLKIISSTRLFGISIATYGVAMSLFVVTNNYTVFAILAALLGLSSGTYQALAPVSIRECVGEMDMAAAFGWDCLFMGVGYFVGPPLSGWLNDSSGNFDSAFAVGGSVMVTSGTLIVIASCLRRHGVCSDTTQGTKGQSLIDDSKEIFLYDYPISSV